MIFFSRKQARSNRVGKYVGIKKNLLAYHRLELFGKFSLAPALRGPLVEELHLERLERQRRRAVEPRGVGPRPPSVQAAALVGRRVVIE